MTGRAALADQEQTVVSLRHSPRPSPALWVSTTVNRLVAVACYRFQVILTDQAGDIRQIAMNEVWHQLVSLADDLLV